MVLLPLLPTQDGAPVSLVYRNEVGLLAIDCPICGQQVVRERSGIGYRFKCYGGHSDAEVVAALDPQVLLELARAEKGASPAGGDPPWRDLVVDGAAFALDAPTVVPAVWGRGDQVLWAEEEPCALVGPQGVGKTTITHRLALGLLGIDGFGQLLGLPVRPIEGNVLLLALDRPAQAARAMRRVVDERHRDTLRKRLHVRRGKLAGDLLKDPELLVRMAVALEAGAVLLDSGKDTGLALNSDEGGAAFNDALQHLVGNGIEALFDHHQRKQGADKHASKPKTLADVYGSVWITAGCGSVVLLWGEPGDPVVKLSHLKQPADVVGPCKLVHNHTAGTVTLDQEGTPRIVAIVEAADRRVTVKQVAFDFFGSTDRNEVEKARRKLEAAVADGELRRVDEETDFGPRATYEPARKSGSREGGHARGSRTPSRPLASLGGTGDPGIVTENRDPPGFEEATADQLAEADRIAAKFKRPNPRGDA